MPLKQSLASFALYLINPKYISSFSACCPTAKGGCAGEGGGQNKNLLLHAIFKFCTTKRLFKYLFFSLSVPKYRLFYNISGLCYVLE